MSKIKIEEMDFSHCLRPEFTLYMIKRLLVDRTSINLIGPIGTGKTRLLEDIRKCQLGNDVRVIYVNLKEKINNYPGLMREVHRGLELDGDIPERLSQLFDKKNTSSAYTLFFLDNYDALLNNPDMDEKYNADFFDDLNFIKNGDHVSLVCATCRKHTTMNIYIKKKSRGPSWLTLEFETLSNLSEKEVFNDLKCRLDENRFRYIQSAHNDRFFLTEKILEHPLPYPLLKEISKAINNNKNGTGILTFREEVKTWIKEFEKMNKKSIERKLHKIANVAEGLVISARANKIRIPIISPISEWIKKKVGA